MLTLAQLRSSRGAEILRLAGDYGATNVRVFGSFARGDANIDSDVDFLVDLSKGRSLLDLIRLQRRLETLLDRKVDVVSSRGMRERVRESVMRDAVPL